MGPLVFDTELINSSVLYQTLAAPIQSHHHCGTNGWYRSFSSQTSTPKAAPSFLLGRLMSFLTACQGIRKSMTSGSVDSKKRLLSLAWTSDRSQMCYLCFKSWDGFSFFCKWTSDVCSLSGAYVTTAPHVANSSFKIYETKTLKLYGSLLKTVSHCPIQRGRILLTKSFLMSHLALK